MVSSLVYNPAAGVVYGLSQQNNTGFAIECSTNRIVARFEAQTPVDIAYNALDNRAYFTQWAGEYDSVIVINGATHQRITAIPLLEAVVPVWDPDNDRLYVSMGGENRVAVIDCRTNAVLREIPVGDYPVGLALNRQHQKLYVQNTDSYDVSIIDLVTNQVIKTIPAGGAPNTGCYCDSAGRYYCSRGHGIVVIDGVSDSTLGLIPGLPDAGIAMVESPAHRVMMVASGDSILAVDTHGDSVVSRLGVGRQPQGLVWSPATDRVYCANWSNSVSVIAGDGSRVVTTLPGGAAPFRFALAPGYRRAYVGCMNTRYVYVIRDTASGIQELLPSGPPGAAPVARPNPFSRSVAIVWNTLTTGGHVARVYAQDGRLVREARIPVGEARWVWDGREGCGAEAPAGVYFIEAAGVARALVVKLE